MPGRRARGYPEPTSSASIPIRAAWPVAAIALALAGSAGAVPGLPGLPRSASVALSSLQAGARPVALTLELDYDMQCGYPGPGPVVIELPAAEHVPSSLEPAQVLVDGRQAASAEISRHAVSVGLSPPPLVMCDVIGPDRLTIALLRSAGFGNPTRPGSYAITLSRAGTTLAAHFTIRAS